MQFRFGVQISSSVRNLPCDVWQATLFFGVSPHVK